MGRPSSYKPEFAKQAEKLCELGATDEELASFFDVDARTIYRWKLDKEEFCQALKSGKQNADERVERSLYQKATGYYYTEQQAMKIKRGQYEEEVEIVDVEKHAPSDTTAAIFWLKNRRQDDWREARDLNVNRGKFDHMTDEELRQYVIDESAKHGIVLASATDGRGERADEETRH